MRSTCSLLIVCIFLSLVLPFRLHPCTDAHDHLMVRYNLPLYELEDVIVTWLHKTGFEGVNTVSERDGVLITASNRLSRWVISLKHYSHMCTDMDACCILEKSGLSDTLALKSLKDFLSVYLQNSDNHAATGSYPKKFMIPDKVIAKTDAVVCISTIYKGRVSRSTGLIIGRKGLILSVAHDKFKTARIEIRFSDDTSRSGYLLKKDDDLDLSLIKAGTASQAPGSFSFPHVVSLSYVNLSLKQGDRLFSVGCPEGMAGTIFPGFICGPPRLAGRLPLWQVCIDASPGGSGSPVFDAVGRFCGIVKGRYKVDNSIGFVIPAEVVLRFLSPDPVY